MENSTNDNYQIVNTSNQDKQTLLANLFALRIAVGSIYTKAQECCDLKMECNSLEADYNRNQNIYNYADQTAVRNIPIPAKEEVKVEHSKERDPLSMGFLFGIIVAAIGIIIFCCVGAATDGYEILCFIGGPVMSIVLGIVVFFIANAIFERKLNIKHAEQLEIAKQQYEEEYAQMLQARLVDVSNESDRIRQGAIKEMNDLRNKYIAVDQRFQSVAKLYEDEYSATRRVHINLLLPADWERLDYIIFALQSGRADSLKEALRYSDEQIRHEQIVSTLYAILDTIKAQTEAIIHTLQECTQNAINSFEDCKQVLVNTISKSSEDMAKSITQASQTISETPTELSVKIKLNDVQIKC